MDGEFGGATGSCGNKNSGMASRLSIGRTPFPRCSSVLIGCWPAVPVGHPASSARRTDRLLEWLPLHPCPATQHSIKPATAAMSAARGACTARMSLALGRWDCRVDGGGFGDRVRRCCCSPWSSGGLCWACCCLAVPWLWPPRSPALRALWPSCRWHGELRSEAHPQSGGRERSVVGRGVAPRRRSNV